MKEYVGLVAISLLALFSCKNNTPPVSGDAMEFSNLFSGPQSQGQITAEIIDEASGLAVSRTNTEFLWTHNDSGGEPALYLMTTNGEDKGTFTLPDANNIDWEDLAAGPGPEPVANYLFVGDIGDNAAQRSSLVIYRVLEPDLNGSIGSINGIFTSIDRIEYQYPDGARDAETLMIDPFTKDIVIITKREPSVRVYRLAYPQSITEINTAEFLVSIPITRFVGGDISSDGLELLMKTYDHVYYWSREPAQDIAETLIQEPVKLNYTPEPQGEAIAFHPNGSAYFTLSEERDGVEAVLYKYERN